MREKERFEVLLEHMDRKIDVVLEGHQVLHSEIKQTREEARIDRESIKQQLSLVAQTLSGKIEKNREKIEQVDQKVEINREKIEQLDRKVEINRKKIEEVDVKLSNV
jgi:CII-binding regulator of phage lambda lysogenization HflD